MAFYMQSMFNMRSACMDNSPDITDSIKQHPSTGAKGNVEKQYSAS